MKMFYIVSILIIIFIKSTVVDILWTMQRHKLIQWSSVLLSILDENNNQTNMMTMIKSQTNEELRELIATLMKNNILNKFNEDPKLLDIAAENSGTNLLIDNLDEKYGSPAVEKKIINTVQPIIRQYCENASREDLITIMKYIDYHIKSKRVWLASGVLSSLDIMTEEQMKNWIYMKITQHTDLNTIEILKLNK